MHFFSFITRYHELVHFNLAWEITTLQETLAEFAQLNSDDFRLFFLSEEDIDVSPHVTDSDHSNPEDSSTLFSDGEESLDSSSCVTEEK